MTSMRDPTAMSPRERLAELAEALAAAYLRGLSRREVSLAEAAHVEAPCESTVDGGRAAEPGRESA